MLRGTSYSNIVSSQIQLFNLVFALKTCEPVSKWHQKQSPVFLIPMIKYQFVIIIVLMTDYCHCNLSVLFSTHKTAPHLSVLELNGYWLR